jgi:hypothetical protein
MDQTIKYDGQKDVFVYSFSRDLAPEYFRGGAIWCSEMQYAKEESGGKIVTGPFYLNEEGIFEVAFKSAEELINFKIQNLVCDLASLRIKKGVFRHKLCGSILATGLSKSRTTKTVFHNIHGVTNHYYLPEEFRKKQFDTAIVVKKGPFTKRRINGELKDCSPWYREDVVQYGHYRVCMKMVVNDYMHHFFINKLLSPLAQAIINRKSETNSIDEIINSISSRINLIYSALETQFEIQNDMEVAGNAESEATWNEIEDWWSEILDDDDGTGYWNMD